MKNNEYYNTNHIKDKLILAAFAVPVILVITWLSEHNYFCIFD